MPRRALLTCCADNWAVLVCTSRFWFNYRHVANTLAVYRAVKRLGMPDSHIILMLADDMACNPRNSEPGTVYVDDGRFASDVYGDNVEVDYKGYEVTVENFIRVLTGRHPEGTPPSKRLQTTDRSNVLLYMTGHGGDEFLKFQDTEEISSHDLADAFFQMWQKRRYNEILFLADTCQAGTLGNHLYSPQILSVGSSAKDENSYSYGHHEGLGVSLVDRFTFKLLEILGTVQIGSSARLFKDVLHLQRPSFLMSTPTYNTRQWRHRPLDDILVTDFFGATVTVETGASPYPLAAGEGEVSKDPWHLAETRDADSAGSNAGRRAASRAGGRGAGDVSLAAERPDVGLGVAGGVIEADVVDFNKEWQRHSWIFPAAVWCSLIVLSAHQAVMALKLSRTPS